MLLKYMMLNMDGALMTQYFEKILRIIHVEAGADNYLISF